MHVQRGQPAGHGEVVAPEGAGVDDAAVHAREHALVNFAAGADGGGGHVAAAEGFREGDDVRVEVPMLEGEHFAGAAEAGLHLVADEERAVFAAERLGLRQEIVARDEDALALHGLGDEGRDVARAQFRLEVVRGRCSGRAPAPGRNGPKPSWKCLLPVMDSAP